MVTNAIKQRHKDKWIPVVDRDTYKGNVNYCQYQHLQPPKILMRGANFIMMNLSSSTAQFYYSRINRYIEWKLKDLSDNDRALLAYKAGRKLIKKWGSGNHSTLKAIDNLIYNKTNIYSHRFLNDL